MNDSQQNSLENQLDVRFMYLRIRQKQELIST